MKKLRMWMAEPLVLPRWMLYVLYALFVILGINLAIIGTDQVTRSPEDYRPYGIAIAVTAALALVASAVRHRHLGIDSKTVWFRIVECASALCLFGLLSVYIATTLGPWLAGDIDRGALGIIVTIASLVPLFRWIGLTGALIRYWVARS